MDMREEKKTINKKIEKKLPGRYCEKIPLWVDDWRIKCNISIQKRIREIQQNKNKKFKNHFRKF